MSFGSGNAQNTYEVNKPIGQVGYNWHGSFPTFIADAKFEPNFRQFNMCEDVSFANEDLHNKLLTNQEGAAEHVMSLSHHRVRGWPLIYSSLILGCTAAWMGARVGTQKTILANPWIAVRYTVLVGLFGNGIRHFMRERTFRNDFERNQYFAYEEIKARRDEQRVKAALEASKYANDPLTEYRVKAWQVSRAGL